MNRMPRTLRLTLAALCLECFALAPPPAAAQSDASEVAARLRPGQRVRIQAPGLAIADGQVAAFSDGMLQVTEEGQEWEVDPRTIERLEVSTHPVVQYGLTFALIGTLAAVAADKFKPDGVDHAVLKGLVAGVGFGILFGLSETKWSVRFPR